MDKIKPLVFWPPFLLLATAVLYSFVDLYGFISVTGSINDWILAHFSWLFSTVTLGLLITVIGVFFSPLARVRIGGRDAEPLLGKWRWFSITLCTTIATGILFWATAEPMHHLHSPPRSLDIIPGSEAAARFAMSSMFLHWSFTPYAIYTVPALTFALTYYNLDKPFSLGAALSPVLGGAMLHRRGEIIDAIALYSLVAGMSASLGAGVLTLAGGLEHMFQFRSDILVQAAITVVIVITFVVSAVSGLKKGIARLSNINAKIFFVYCGFVFLFGPTLFILSMGAEGLGEYVQTFLQKSLFTGLSSGDPWPQTWTIFYWANWFAWAPVTAMFLGRIARGYTVRQFICVNLILPSLFACVWMSTFSGTAIHMDLQRDGALYSLMRLQGEEAVIYEIFNHLPLAQATVALFVFVTFLSYVTAADSNTEAISHLCTEGARHNLHSQVAASVKLKLIWGVSIGTVAWIMVSFAKIDGIRMMSNLGGLPAMFIILGLNVALIKMLFSEMAAT